MKKIFRGNSPTIPKSAVNETEISNQKTKVGGIKGQSEKIEIMRVIITQNALISPRTRIRTHTRSRTCTHRHTFTQANTHMFIHTNIHTHAHKEKCV